MSVPPNIPTSFVPRQSLDTPRRKMHGGNNVFLLIGLFIFGLSVALAVGVFAYQKYLESVVTVKEAALSSAEATISKDVVEEYVRLKQRFVSGRELLDNHVALSQFFAVLESLTLQNVKFDDLTLTVAEDRTASITIEGIARNFNTLAAQSSAVAGERAFKRAIFSDISVNDNGTVGFSLSADIDPSLIAMQEAAFAEEPVVEAPAPATPAATTTAPSQATTTQPRL
ncbi:MAG TPA: hypothetical protein VNU47_02675 [Candidatus Paceibacterota bacterium]|nr:hypothetical protein [Candidatus Paceibacterota bacterium]